MTPYDRLKSMVADDPRFMETVKGAFWALRYGAYWQAVFTNMADTLCGRHSLSAEVHGNAVILWNSSSRAKQPACVVISRDAGQTASPSALYVRRNCEALIQVFEGDADDGDELLEGLGQNAIHWTKAQGRVLLH